MGEQSVLHPPWVLLYVRLYVPVPAREQPQCHPQEPSTSFFETGSLTGLELKENGLQKGVALLGVVSLEELCHSGGWL